jgi:hypothetical protein
MEMVAMHDDSRMTFALQIDDSRGYLGKYGQQRVPVASIRLLCYCQSNDFENPFWKPVTVMTRFTALLTTTLMLFSTSAPCGTLDAREQSGLATVQASNQDDTEILTGMLHAFLGASGTREVHETFWAEDLVYTSSSGMRFGKAEILKGFEGPENQESEGPAVVYSGEDVNIRLFGTTAVITFKLVGKPDDGSAVKYYFNTGTFLKRGGKWKAVAWQATAIPDK